MGLIRRLAPATVALALALICVVTTSKAKAQDRLTLEALYPEGPVLIGGVLHFAEMTADRVAQVERGYIARAPTPEGCGPTSISPYGQGIVVLCHLSGGLLVMSLDGDIEATITHDEAGAELTYPNDSHEDRAGGVYFSSSGVFNPSVQPSGRLFHLRADGTVHQVAGDLTYPNGVFVTDDKMLYVSEHLGKRILRFQIHNNFTLAGAQEFADHTSLGIDPPARNPLVGPDGIEVAGDGTVYVAIYGASKVLIIGTDGIVRSEIPAPMRYLTNIVLDEAAGRAFLAGAFNNRTWPYRGQVLEVALPE
jgi:sugar lactone lactonase YvrE